jgi:hypothetical protein
VLKAAPVADGALRIMLFGAAMVATILLIWWTGLARTERQRILVWVQS